MTDDWSIYSCDDHLDLNAVPPEMWQSRLPNDVAPRAPRVEPRDGVPTWICDGRVLGRSGRPPGSSDLKALSAIGRAGIDDDGFRGEQPQAPSGGHGS